jgi:hypothetical protein
MELSPEERQKINESLAALKQMTVAQVDRVARHRNLQVDAEHLNKLIEAYVSEDGFAFLLLDTLLTGQNCTCGNTCSVPCNYYMRCKEESSAA